MGLDRMVTRLGSEGSGLSVYIEAPARLHLGFLDLHGGLGRRFGSIGLAIDSIAVRLRAERAATVTACGPGAERAVKYANHYIERHGIDGGVSLSMQQTIPEHIGFGSGTQMALAVGTALNRIYGRDGDSAAVARTMCRGTRSGIGIGVFEQGGFILDSGRADAGDGGVPPAVFRAPLPAAWRLLLLFDSRRYGLHGAAEANAFAALPEFPESAAGQLCRLALMQLLPSLLEQKFQPFADAIGEIQRVVGDHFAPAQGGRFASPVIAESLAWVSKQGVTGIGQSSWGPTGFVLVEDAEQAQRLEQGLGDICGIGSPLRCQQVSARNRGYLLRMGKEAAELRQQESMR